VDAAAAAAAAAVAAPAAVPARALREHTALHMLLPLQMIGNVHPALSV
jgi:hypothetical protein